MLSRHFRSLWLAALALLVFAQVLHVGEHWRTYSQAAHFHHEHDADHSHSHAPTSEPCNAPAGKSHLVEHSHSPAIVEAHSFFGIYAVVWGSHPIALTAPEAPVAEIDYPPQLA